MTYNFKLSIMHSDGGETQMNNYKISMAAARVNAKKTQEEVAKQMQVTKQTIVNWENGKVIPKPAQFKMYCDVVGAPEDIIFLSTT